MDNFFWILKSYWKIAFLYFPTHFEKLGFNEPSLSSKISRSLQNSLKRDSTVLLQFLFKMITVRTETSNLKLKAFISIQNNSKVVLKITRVDIYHTVSISFIDKPGLLAWYSKILVCFNPFNAIAPLCFITFQYSLVDAAECWKASAHLTPGFLTFSGVIEMEHWTKMGLKKTLKVR